MIGKETSTRQFPGGQFDFGPRLLMFTLPFLTNTRAQVTTEKTERHIPPQLRQGVCLFLCTGLLCRTKGGKLEADKMPEKEKRHGIYKG